MDLAALRSTLTGTRWHDIRHFESIDSTNRWLQDEAAAGRIGSGTVAIADAQTAGRGRLGRTWTAPSGSALLMSVYVESTIAADHRPLLGLAVGVAAVDAAARFVPAAGGAALKWPNDVIVDDPAHPQGYRKLAGVLAAAGGDGVVIGIGLNVCRPTVVPDELVANAAPIWLDDLTRGGSIEEVSDDRPAPPPTVAAVASAVLEALDLRLTQLSAAVASFLSDYRSMCATLGRQVTLETSDGTTSEAKAVDIDDLGRLVIDRVGALDVVSAGDVHHLRPT